MSRPINADALITSVAWHDQQGMISTIDDILDIIDAFPTLTPPNEWVNRLRKLDELYTKIYAVTGYTAEQLLEMFAAGYTLQKPDYSKSMKELADLEEITPQNEWISVEERLPELPDASWCSRSIIVCDKDSNVAPLLWARAQVRGKTVERWKYHWGRIYNGPEITHWMPLPASPDRRPPEGEEDT